MAKQVYEVGGVKVRANDPTQASTLAAEVATNPTKTPGTIPVSTLTAPVQTPMNVPNLPIPTAGVGLSANLATRATQNEDAYVAEQEALTKQRETGYTNSLDAVLQNLTDTEGKVSATDRAYRDTVDPAKKALRDINQQILADTEAERQQIISIKENSKGRESQGVADMISDLQDKGIQRRAGLAVTQLAAQGEYQGAKEIADRAVEAQMEKQKLKNETLQFIYQENKELFNKAEQRQFETAQKDRDRKFEFDTFKKKAEFSQLLEENSPSAKLDRQLKSISIQKAQKELDILNNPVTTAGLDDATLARIEKLPLTAKDSLVNANDTIDQLTRIKTLVANTDLATLQNPLTPEGLLFRRLATDVADKMARERTGAVVTKEEQGNFKSILGLSFGARLVSDPTVVNAEVDKFINKHNQTRKLIDPTGKITEYLGQATGDTTTSYVDNVAKTLGGGASSDALGSWLNSFSVK